jgi:hypothetical protein
MLSWTRVWVAVAMNKNQTVNKSIDGKSVTRALMPGHPTNANLWYKHIHCSSCSARPAKLKKCPCGPARYCNSDWKAHKSSH